MSQTTKLLLELRMAALSCLVLLVLVLVFLGWHEWRIRAVNLRVDGQERLMSDTPALILLMRRYARPGPVQVSSSLAASMREFKAANGEVRDPCMKAAIAKHNRLRMDKLKSGEPILQKEVDAFIGELENCYGR